MNENYYDVERSSVSNNEAFAKLCQCLTDQNHGSMDDRDLSLTTDISTSNRISELSPRLTACHEAVSVFNLQIPTNLNDSRLSTLVSRICVPPS